MPSQVIADVYASGLEKIRADLPMLYEGLETEAPTVYGMISKDVSKFEISRTPNGTDFRIPLETQPPSDFGGFSLDGGSLGAGNATKTAQMYQSAFPLSLAVDLGFGSIIATDSPTKAKMDTLKRNLKLSMQSFRRMADSSFFNIGSGNQGLVALATGYAAGTFTFDTEYGGQLLQVGQPVEIFSNDLLTHRTSAVPDNLPYIARIAADRSTAVVTNLGAISPGTDDYLAFRGVGGTPTWLNGLNYFHNTATSGNLLGLSRTTYPELVPTFVDVAGALTPTHGGILNTKVYNRCGDIPSSVKGVINPAQALQIYTVGIAISEWTRGKSDSMIDIMPKMNDRYLTFNGVVHMKSNKQSKKRVDWLNTDGWGRVYMRELDFYTDPDGKMRFFEGRNSSGKVTANWNFFLVAVENFFNANPTKEAFLYNASVPSGV